MGSKITGLILYGNLRKKIATRERKIFEDFIFQIIKENHHFLKESMILLKIFSEGKIYPRSSFSKRIYDSSKIFFEKNL